MKLITLNVWGGKIFEPLMNFLRREAPTTDIFCFQEVYHTHSSDTRTHATTNTADLFSRFSKLFSEYKGYFASVQDTGVEDIVVPWGIAIFVRRRIEVESYGDFFVYRDRNSMITGDPSTIPRNVQYLRFSVQDQPFTLCNLHGLYKEGSHKLDTPERIAQSEKIRQFLDGEAGVKILCGDFNLAPNTKSLGILEQGMRNLIKEYKITCTRSPLYRDYSKGVLYADYVLVSPEVPINNFQVLPEEISDHLPLMVEFD